MLALLMLRRTCVSAAVLQGHPELPRGIPASAARAIAVSTQRSSGAALATAALHPRSSNSISSWQPSSSSSPSSALPPASASAARRISFRRAAHPPHHQHSHSEMAHVQFVTSEFLSADDVPPGTHLHLIVLNYVLPLQTARLWKRATTRICADGGANRLYDQIAAMLPGVDPEAARSSFLPDLIKGDLDSVRPDVQEFYTSHGVPMIDLSSDQETTDLEKCLLFLEGRLRTMGEQQQQQRGQQQQHYGLSLQPQQQESVPHAAAGAAAASREQDVVAVGSGRAGGVGAGGGYAGALSSSSSSTSYAAGAGASLPHEQQQQLGVPQHNGNHQQPQQPQEEQQQQQEQPSLHPISGRVVFLDQQQPESSSMDGAAVQQLGAGEGQQPHHHHHNHHHHHHHHNQQQPQQPGTQAAAAGPSNGGNNSSSSSPNSTNNGTAAGAGAGGAVREVYASVLGSDSDDLSAAAGGGPAAKRLHQEHVILVLGALGGRLDHTLSNLNTLYCFRHLNMALWGDGNLVRLLRAGRATIHPARCEGPTCGLVPLARPATASSTGLKWDLDNTHMCFRGLLSTSNIIMSDTITVATDEDLLWITAVEDATAPSKL